MLNFIAKHLIGGVAFVIGVVLLIIGLFSTGSGLVWTGGLTMIGAVAFMAYNMYRGFAGVGSAVNEMSFGSKEAQRRRSSRKLSDDSDFDFGDFGDGD